MTNNNSPRLAISNIAIILSIIFAIFFIYSDLFATNCFVKNRGDSTSAANACNAHNDDRDKCLAVEDDGSNNTISCGWYDASAYDVEGVDALCNILNLITGPGGKVFAAIVIITVGVGFFTGKVSWGLLIGVACGIGVLFGAEGIVSAISGEDKYSCRPTS